MKKKKIMPNKRKTKSLFEKKKTNNFYEWHMFVIVFLLLGDRITFGVMKT